jgi:hypothetical protein
VGSPEIEFERIIDNTCHRYYPTTTVRADKPPLQRREKAGIHAWIPGEHLVIQNLATQTPVTHSLAIAFTLTPGKDKEDKSYCGKHPQGGSDNTMKHPYRSFFQRNDRARR